jgi:endo-beta-N-acetylglucosaminidase D
LSTQFNAPMAKEGEKGTFTAGYKQGQGLFAHIEFPLSIPGFQATKFTGDLDAQGIRAGVTLVPKDAKIVKQAKIEIGYDFKTGLFVQGMLTLTPTTGPLSTRT